MSQGKNNYCGSTATLLGPGNEAMLNAVYTDFELTARWTHSVTVEALNCWSRQWR